MNSTTRDLSNIFTVARREFVARAQTRTYLVATLVLVVAAGLVGLIPVAVNYFNREPAQVAIYVGAGDLRADPVSTLDALLNPPTRDGGETQAIAQKTFEVSLSKDLAADRQRVMDGKLTALLDVERDAQGELVFTVYTKDTGDSQTALVSRQAATSIAVADRLGRAGVTPTEQAALFSAPQVTVRSPDLSEKAPDSQPTATETTRILINFGLELFLLMAIILYGNWVAQSVVEEKSSRMMEIMLAAASPFQLLTGKILGVSVAALLQFAAVIAAAVAAVVAEGQVASAILGGSAQVDLPAGLTPSLLVTFSVLFVLGFVLYAALFAAAGSLVSRQEDVNQIVMPMTLAACGGYLVAMYSGIGLLDPNSPWIVALSYVPFLSPYMMVSSVNAGDAGLLQVGIAALLLVATIAVAAWLAARIYAAGVLMYGQAPSMRRMLAAIRTGS
jgi:ABC-2 type transport system permease protein